MTDSTPTPDPELDAMLAQADALRRRYANAVAAETPSAAAEARIRAAAWAAVDATPPATGGKWWRRLRVPVSIAAVLVLTSSAMLAMLRDTGERSLVDPLPKRARAPAAASPASGADEIVPSGSSAESKVAPPPQPASRQQRHESATGGTPPAAWQQSSDLDRRTSKIEQVRETPSARDVGENAVQPAARPESPARESDAVRAVAGSAVQAEERVREPARALAAAPDKAAGRATAFPPPPPAAPAAAVTVQRAGKATEQLQGAAPELRNRTMDSAAGSTGHDPAEWLERIRRQWTSGAHETATEDLAAFRRAYPGYRIPADFPVPVPTDTPQR